MEAQVSIARLEKFFAAEELDPYQIIHYKKRGRGEEERKIEMGRIRVRIDYIE
jgi:hypothetical protein